MGCSEVGIKTEEAERDNPPEHTLLCTVLKSFLDDARCLTGRRGVAYAQVRGQILVTHAQSKWIGTVCELVDVNQEALVKLLEQTIETRLLQLKEKGYG